MERWQQNDFAASEIADVGTRVNRAAAEVHRRGVSHRVTDDGADGGTVVTNTTSTQ